MRLWLNAARETENTTQVNGVPVLSVQVAADNLARSYYFDIRANQSNSWNLMPTPALLA